MASRIAEVVYKLRDLFTGPAKNVEGGYEGIRRESRRAADSVQRDNQRMSGSFGSLGRAAKAGIAGIVAAFSAREVVGRIGDVANELDRLGKAAGRLKIDPGVLAGFEFALERSGVAASKATGALDTLQKRTGEALNGIGQARIAFENLGISIEAFANLDAEQQLVTIAEALRAVASEEERAALASQLLSKANIDLLNALELGGPALQNLINQGREYSGVTAEMTKAAAAYNDALSDLSKQLDGQKFKALTPIIQGLSDGFTKLGFRDVGDDIEAISLRIEYLEDLLRRNPFAGEKEKQEIEELTQRLIEIARTERELAKTREETARKQTEAAEASSLYQVSVEQLTDSFDAQTKAQKANLDQQTRELQTARNQQVSIEREFAQLREDINTKPVEDVTGLDIQTKVLEARRRLAAGDAEGAIRSAQQGAALLRQLQSQGEESGYVLSFLAKQLETVANKAAQTQVDIELVDEQKAQAEFDGVKNKADALKSDMVTTGSELGKAFVAAIQSGIDQAPALTGPAMPAPTPQIVREGNSFSQSVRREINRRGGK